MNNLLDVVGKEIEHITVSNINNHPYYIQIEFSDGTYLKIHTYDNNLVIKQGNYLVGWDTVNNER